MKKRLLLLLLCIFLFGCDNPTNIVSSGNHIDSKRLNDDSVALLNSQNLKVYDENYEFKFNCDLIPSNEFKDYYIVTVEIGYKEEQIDNIRIISFPYEFTTNDFIYEVCNVGYIKDATFCLDNRNTVIGNKHYFKGFRLSYLTQKITGVKVSIKGKLTNDKEIDYQFYELFNETNELSWIKKE